MPDLKYTYSFHCGVFFQTKKRNYQSVISNRWRIERKREREKKERKKQRKKEETKRERKRKKNSVQKRKRKNPRKAKNSIPGKSNRT